MTKRFNLIYFIHFQILSVLILLLGVFFLSRSGFSATINQKLANGFIVTAEYYKGDKAKAAVFILHGFLQTREYLTVQSLISATRDEGYTVLAPNLSLGISNRKKSLACEAIHNHDMKQDIDEIEYWTKWLENKGNSNIILLGHSYGSLQVLIYANKKNPASVKKLITTSLIDVERSNNITTKDFIQLARTRIFNNDNALYSYPIFFCKNFTSPSRNYLSYSKWSKEKILVELLRLKIPITIILGGNDSRINKDWIKYLSRAKLKTIYIEGANHFFDNNHEFDMNDSVLNEMLLN